MVGRRHNARRLLRFDPTDRPLWIRIREVKRMTRLALWAQQIGYLEVCGMVAVNRRGELTLHHVRNSDRRPYRHAILARDAKRIGARCRSVGRRVLCTFHSHPMGYAIPGEGDIERGFWQDTAIIYDVCGADLRLWRKRRVDDQERAEEIPLKIVR